MVASSSGLLLCPDPISCSLHCGSIPGRRFQSHRRRRVMASAMLIALPRVCGLDASMAAYTACSGKFGLYCAAGGRETSRQPRAQRKTFSVKIFQSHRVPVLASAHHMHPQMPHPPQNTLPVQHSSSNEAEMLSSTPLSIKSIRPHAHHGQCTIGIITNY